MSDKFFELDTVLDAESWDYIYTNYPPLAEAVKKAVEKGIGAAEIKQRVMQKLGAHREALAQRCELAARHLERNK